MDNRRFFSLFLLVSIFTILISGCSGVGRIDSFFSNQEYLQHAKMIDFGLFFIMFFALCYLGFTMAWGKGFGQPGGAKGPIVGLSFAFSLSLAFAVVTQTSFSITTIFPIAKAIFFIILWFLLWGLLNKTEILGKDWFAKVVYAILAAMMIYIIASIFTHTICQMSDNMDDPACQSDFFNFFYNIMGDLFGGLGLGSGDGGGSGGGDDGGSSGRDGSGDGSIDRGNGNIEEIGNVNGGCRLDITFDYDSTNINSPSPIDDYVKSVRLMGRNSIHVYGFASKEGRERYNFGLSSDRARTIRDLIKSADSSMGIDISGKGPTERFDINNLEPNRRVVLSTELIGAFMPAPGVGSLYNCPTDPNGMCGNNNIEGSEECDKDKDDACPGKCKPDCKCEIPSPADLCGNEKWDEDKDEVCDPTVASSCEDGKCASDCSKCEDDDNGFPSWLWWLIPIIALLILWLLVKRKVEVKIKDALAMKDKFLQSLLRIRTEKELAWANIVIVNPGTTTQSEIERKAQYLIETLEKELTEKKWKNIKKLFEDYNHDLKLILSQGKPFSIEDHNLDLLVHILEEFKKKHNSKTGFFAKKVDSITFNLRLKEIVIDVISNNQVKKELHHFCGLQHRLKKETENFSADEEKILVQYRKIHSSTMFGRHWWGTRHIVKKDGFPWLTTKKEVEGKLVEEVVTPSTTYGLVEVTQEVKNLCQELITKIAEVLDEEKNVTHHVTTRTDFTKKYDEEKDIIKRLEHAIMIQKKLMSEEWWPVIDRIEPPNGRLEGHVHHRLY